MSTNIVVVNNVAKKYGSEYVLQNLNMNVNKGDIYGFVGQNGSGKTTTMKIILSLIKENTGTISLFGKSDEASLQRYRERIGSVIENPAFYPYLTARENLLYYSKMMGVTDRKAVAKSLEVVGLQEAKRKKYKNFSLGMKQRLGLGLAILNHPDLLILDEPLNGLDPQGIRAFRKTLLKLNQEWGVTIIISSHILEELTHIATRYGFIHHGTMLEEISVLELQERCGKYLVVKVDDVKAASYVLEQVLHTDEYKVIDDNTINLFSYVDDSQELITALVTNQVHVKEVEKVGNSLEDYFLQLIGGEE